MNKNEYLDRLSHLLADISYEEHEEALSYYREYIDDAGAENEQRVIEELGTPEQLAKEIREGLLNNEETSKRGREPINAPESVTGNGNAYNDRTHNGRTYNDRAYNDKTYNDKTYNDKAYNDKTHNDKTHNDRTYNGNAAGQKSERDNSKIILIILLLIIASPLWFSLACTLIGMIFACIAGSAAIGAAGIICIITGFALIAAGISPFLSLTALSSVSVLTGFALIGAGLVTAALGILFVILTVWLFGRAFPALIRFIRQTVSNISRTKKEAHV